MWETWVQSLGWDDPLEKVKGTHSRPGEVHGLYSPWGCKQSDTTEQLSLYCVPESAASPWNQEVRIGGLSWWPSG